MVERICETSRLLDFKQESKCRRIIFFETTESREKDQIDLRPLNQIGFEQNRQIYKSVHF